MKKYLAFFKLRFAMGLQYRAAALAGIATQFAWGFIEIMAMHVFYTENTNEFPMDFAATASYIWLPQAFLALFAAWMMENEIFDSIINGNITYELCRPVSIYNMWFSRSLANRLSRVVLRCFPIIVIALFLPHPYGLSAPAGLQYFLLFLITLALGLAVTVSFCMLVYVLTFFTISPQGLRILFTCSIELFTGEIIPLPFFPESLQKIMELLPFASMQNVALRIYSGSMDNAHIQKAIILQLAWLVVITLTGKILCYLAEKKITIQGG